MFCLHVFNINIIENIVLSDYQNEGLKCWNKCEDSVNSQCDYCGKKGICCRQGFNINECDGKVGGSNHHECTKPATEGTI